MFEAEEIRILLSTANVRLRAMALLGVNCGLSNSDTKTLLLRDVIMASGSMDKASTRTTYLDRQRKLWTKTVNSLEASLTARKKPRRKKHEEIFFMTRYGGPWRTVNVHRKA